MNVGCNWLWHVKPYFSFDIIHGTKRFHEFESEQQFRKVAEELATSGLENVERYRQIFRTVRQVSEYYVQNSPNTFWPYFDAAIAHMLSGRVELGCKLLSECLVARHGDPQWLTEARQDAKMLACITHQPDKFVEAISDRVRETRRLLKLPPLHQVEFWSERVAVG